MDWSGGNNNSATGVNSAVLGGQQNSALGYHSTVGGGRRIKAQAYGSYAIGDAQNEDFVNSTYLGFAARFAGGYRFAKSEDVDFLTINSDGKIDVHNNQVANLVVEQLPVDPEDPEIGRIWMIVEDD